jgi:hypothetical protein
VVTVVPARMGVAMSVVMRGDAGAMVVLARMGVAVSVVMRGDAGAMVRLIRVGVTVIVPIGFALALVMRLTVGVPVLVVLASGLAAGAFVPLLSRSVGVFAMIMTMAPNVCTVDVSVAVARLRLVVPVIEGILARARLRRHLQVLRG